MSPNSTSTLFTGHFEPKRPLVSDVTDGAVGAAIRQALCGRPGVGESRVVVRVWGESRVVICGQLHTSLLLCRVAMCGQSNCAV